jgi:hypothetical protein
VLRVAITGAGCAFLGRRVGGSGSNRYEYRKLAGSGAQRYLAFRSNEPSRGRDAQELIVGDGDRSHGAPNAASVKVESVRVCDGDFLVLGPHSTWVHLFGDEAVQSVGRWMREREWEQGGSSDFGLGWPLGAHGDPDLLRDVDETFVGMRENAANRVLQSI